MLGSLVFLVAALVAWGAAIGYAVARGRRRRAVTVFFAPAILYLMLWGGFELWAWYDPAGYQAHLNRTLQSEGFLR